MRLLLCLRTRVHHFGKLITKFVVTSWLLFLHSRFIVVLNLLFDWYAIKSFHVLLAGVDSPKVLDSVCTGDLCWRQLFERLTKMNELGLNHLVPANHASCTWTRCLNVLLLKCPNIWIFRTQSVGRVLTRLGLLGKNFFHMLKDSITSSADSKLPNTMKLKRKNKDQVMIKRFLGSVQKICPKVDKYRLS